MKQEKQTFCINQIILEKESPFEISNFPIDKIHGKTEVTTIGKEIVEILKPEISVFEKRFFCIYFQQGGMFPYPTTVVHTKDLTEGDNPRPPEDIELSKQYFVLVDKNTQRIFLSNQKERSSIESWLNKKLGKTVFIKPLLAEKDFIDKIQSVSEMSFTVIPNLWNTAGGKTLSEALVDDVLGYEADEATLKLKYSKPLSKKLRDRTKELLGQKEQYKEITIVGKSIDGLESIFNTTAIVNKLTISSTQDSSKKFIPEEVFSTLIKEIKKRDGN